MAATIDYHLKSKSFNETCVSWVVFQGCTTADLLSITIHQKELRGIRERKINLLTLRKGIITTMMMLDPNLIILAKVKERI